MTKHTPRNRAYTLSFVIHNDYLLLGGGKSSSSHSFPKLELTCQLLFEVRRRGRRPEHPPCFLTKRRTFWWRYQSQRLRYRPLPPEAAKWRRGRDSVTHNLLTSIISTYYHFCRRCQRGSWSLDVTRCYPLLPVVFHLEERRRSTQLLDTFFQNPFKIHYPHL